MKRGYSQCNRYLLVLETCKLRDSFALSTSILISDYYEFMPQWTEGRAGAAKPHYANNPFSPQGSNGQLGVLVLDPYGRWNDISLHCVPLFSATHHQLHLGRWVSRAGGSFAPVTAARAFLALKPSSSYLPKPCIFKPRSATQVMHGPGSCWWRS